MDTTTALVAIVAAALIGIAALALISARQRREARAADPESPFAASTEGEKRCPHCGAGNLWTDATCLQCGGALPDAHLPQ